MTVTSFPSANGVPYAPFAPGDGAARRDAYNITVTNAGYATTTGPVTARIELPGGLTALALSAAGWSCTVAAATCSWPDGVTLGAGERGQITLEVAVSRDAPQSMQTLIQATGGGEVPPASLDTADHYNVVSNGGEQIDPTYITPAAGG